MAVLHYDLASPYAYLAVSRAREVLPEPPRLQPVLAGAIFAHRGWGSWADMDTRGANMVEIAARAARYGLPPITWPPGWPPNSLQAMRACVWAERVGGAECAERFALTAFRAAFAQCADLSDMMVLTAAAHRAGLPAHELPDGIADPAVKQALKDATDAAIAAGVNGVPTLITDAGAVLFGDDRLEEAA
ncbi:2-hydroxychromene-2-carboxylate isomerase [Conexibacter woesei]|uniref:2-hydroxychromene-2-carboxylate isomerase n=1 Tax=Conexibacter woesei TaxID=191495 RepID=UPI0003F51FFF|nr:DsbA family protein [Conexibacter woesei]